MPRPTYPSRPGSQMLDQRFEMYHRPVADLQMTARCTIVRPASQADATFDDATGRTVYPPPAALYAGPCRVQASNRLAGGAPVGDREVVLHRYTVAIPAGTLGLAVGDLLTITDAPHDPTLVGRALWVIDIIVGSVTWQQDLVVDDTPPVNR